jgi:hypothetical protein
VALRRWAAVRCFRRPRPNRPAVSVSAPGTDYMKENAEVSALLAYYQDLLDMPAEELKREYQGISQSFARDRSELGRLRLALLMCVPGAAWRDDAKLLALLDGAASRKAPPDSPRRSFHRLAAEAGGRASAGTEARRRTAAETGLHVDYRAQPARTATPEKMTEAKAQILLVDDDRDLLKLISLRLTAAGYAVQTAESGAQALAQLAWHAPASSSPTCAWKAWTAWRCSIASMPPCRRCP